MAYKLIAVYAAVGVAVFGFAEYQRHGREEERTTLAAKISAPETKLVSIVCTTNAREFKRTSSIIKRVTYHYQTQNGEDVYAFDDTELEHFYFRVATSLSERTAYWASRVNCPVGRIVGRKEP